MHLNTARALLIGLLLLLGVLAIVPMMNVADFRSREIVVRESLQCVSAVCVEDRRSGKECTFIRPVVSKVLITVDPEDTRRRIVRVEPTNADCR